MKILVAGVGKLGSTVAYTLLMKLHVEKMVLYDIKDLSGDIIDLENATFFNPTKITTELEPVDYLIVCAGFGRKNKDDDLLSMNRVIFTDVFKKLESIIDYKTTIIIMTNPVLKMTELARQLLPKNKVVNPEKILMQMRKGKELGWDIVSVKGYSNFGPAVSVCMLIEELESTKQ